MAAKRKRSGEHEISEATTKLGRLLETEDELETMLKDVRQKAKELVELAHTDADNRVRQFELQLEGEDVGLRERIAHDRDRTIDSIREEARRETERLDGLDDATITELAHYVVDLLMGRPNSRGSR